jgi:ComF family protein
VPVPLSDARLRERGYNQAWELARRIARRTGTRAEASLLLRIRDTPHQLDLPPDARAGNVRGAFAIEPRRLGELRGRRVAVVDDVMTTGSTAGEIARVLKLAGAARVEVWVVARTPRPEDE